MINLSGNYNLTELVAVNTFSDGLKFVNSSVNGLYFGGLLVIIFFIMLLALTKQDKMSIQKGVMYSGALTTIIALPLQVMGVINLGVLALLVVVTLVGLLLTRRS